MKDAATIQPTNREKLALEWQQKTTAAAEFRKRFFFQKVKASNGFLFFFSSDTPGIVLQLTFVEWQCYWKTLALEKWTKETEEMSTMFTITSQCLKITKNVSFLTAQNLVSTVRLFWMIFKNCALLPPRTTSQFWWGEQKNVFWLDFQDRKWQYTWGGVLFN